MVAPTPSGYSANVRLELLVGDRRFPLAQIGGGRLIFREPVVLSCAAGEVSAHIDEHVQRWHVTWDASDAPRRIVYAEFREIPCTASPDPTTATSPT